MTKLKDYSPAGFREGQKCSKCDEWVSPGDGADCRGDEVVCEDCLEELEAAP